MTTISRTPQSSQSPELRTCCRCGRQRPLADVGIASAPGGWQHHCLDEVSCDAAGLAASRGRARRLIDAVLGRGQ